MSQRFWKGRGGFSQQGGYRSNQNGRAFKPCANPLFESWIMEWKADAEARDHRMKFVYAKALSSLRKYPLPLSSGKECSILENFGAHMCKMLDDRMAKENIVPEVSQGFSIDSDSEMPGPSSKVTAPVAKRKKVKNSPVKESDSAFSPVRQPQSKKKRKEAQDLNDCVTLSDSDDDKLTKNKSNKQKKPAKNTRAYIPAYRSGGYAILLAMLEKEFEPDYRGYMSRTEIISNAQKYCDSSMSKADHAKGSHYTSWNSMKALLTKDLVSSQSKRGTPSLYSLTDEGRELADKIMKAEKNDNQQQQRSQGHDQEEQQQSSGETWVTAGSRSGPSSIDSNVETGVDFDSDCDDSCSQTSGKSSGSNLPQHSLKIEARKFEIILYVDNCETSGNSKSQELINELQKNGVRTQVTKLSVGDFIWICRELVSSGGANRNRLTIGGTQNELVLPYVVERKRSDDLAHSIRDGRYREQKYRLERTNLQVVYLIESYGKGDWGLAEGALSQAIINTQVKNGFLVQETSSIKDTCAYLTFMTRHLQAMYENKTLLGINKVDYRLELKSRDPNEAYLMFFTDFNDFSVKKANWTVKELFARQLMRMKGLSPDKAFAIVQLYPTVHSLFKAYDECLTEKEKERLLANIHFGSSKRNIGPGISRKIYKLYNSKELN